MKSEMIFIKGDGRITNNPKEATRFEYFEYDSDGNVIKNLVGAL